MIDQQYRFIEGEAVIKVEIYFPKNANYQIKLHKTLSNGFNLDYEKYFLKDKNRKKQIRELLRKYNFIVEKFNKKVKNANKVFFGYSLYEVDGVFYSFERDSLDEERTQIVRLIFKPDLEDIRTKIQEKLGVNMPTNCMRYIIGVVNQTRYLNRDIHNIKGITKVVNKFLKKNKEAITMDKKAMSKIANIIYDWIDYVGLFLFGYVIYELTSGSDCIEDEIWVTSSWSEKVNIIQRAK